MTITAEQLRRWAEALCRLEPAQPDAALSALGWGGAARTTRDWVELASPPPGTTVAKLAMRDGLVDHAYLELPDGGGPTKAALDAALGAARALPMIAPAVIASVMYRVTVAGAKATCAVIPGFAGSPANASTPMHVALRRDRA